MNPEQRLAHAVTLLVIVILAFSVPAVAAQPPATAFDSGAQHAVAQLLERMPLLFVPEQVSADGAMGFAVRGSEASVWLTTTGLSFRLNPHGGTDSGTSAGSWVVALDFVGAPPRQPVGEDQLQTRVSYFKGPQDQWRTGLRSFGSVRYREPWPGVDLVVSGTAGTLETTFIVQPGADPSAIRLAYRGATSVRIDPDGALVVDTPRGSITEQTPVAYQQIGGERVQVSASFELEQDLEPGLGAYRFRLGDYDPTRELVVDPVTLIYCGYIGGSGYDFAYGIAVDAADNAYVIGTTKSTEASFPVRVGPDLTYNGGTYGDAFVAKVNSAGSALEYCGYIGGSSTDYGKGIAVDTAGNAYVTGETFSSEASFPVSTGPDLTYNGDSDVFVAKIDSAGTALEYCGYVGGADRDTHSDIAVDAAGRAYVTGWTDSTEATFPVAIGPDLTSNGGPTDAFVAKVNAAGTALEFCGYIGGIGNDYPYGIAVDGAASAYVTGFTFSGQATFPVTVGPDLTGNGGANDAFVAKVNALGASLDYCGYIGGSDADHGYAIAVDVAGNAYVTGATWSTEATFPVLVGPDLTHNGGGQGRDAFVAKVNAAGTNLDYCGYIGGSAEDNGWDIAVDTAGNAHVAGYANSTEATFPVLVGPDLSYNGGDYDAFVARVNADGSALDYCGYIGGSDRDVALGIAVDGHGIAYVTGGTDSTQATFPVAVGPGLIFNGGTNDVFVAKVSSPNLVFTDGFESGDITAWTALIADLADQFNVIVLERGIYGEYADCQFDSQTGIYSYLGQSFHESDGGLGGTPIVTVTDLYWKNEFLASTVPPYNLEDPDHDGVPSYLDADALDPGVW
jgi:hypothetical protein